MKYRWNVDLEFRFRIDGKSTKLPFKKQKQSPNVFYKKGVLNFFLQNLQENTIAGASFLIKLQV